MRALVSVLGSADSAALDAATIARGVPSRALMQRAGALTAAEIALRYRDRLSAGVLVAVGPGNNGGDGWVVARALALTGARVRVVEPIAAKSPDAVAERELALDILDPAAVASGVIPDPLDQGEGLVVDALLGTGSSGAPRGSIADAVVAMRRMRERGAAVVAVDLPTGLDATSGDAPGPVVQADLTVTFGAVKRGHLVNRAPCGAIVVVDIGLMPPHSGGEGPAAPRLVDEAWAAAQVPHIPANAHKGIRKKLAILGGAAGMAGATVLAARAALRSGAGLVKAVVAPDSLPPIQEAEPSALAAVWPESEQDVERDIARWADCLVIGPGLGRSPRSREVLELALRGWTGPTLLDADALTLFEARAQDLAALLGGRPALITPHPVEFARLADRDAATVLAERFEIGAELAARLGAVVLLKGTPTVVSEPGGARLVSATGTPALATGGSGDVLSGIGGTLLAQIGDPFAAGALAAWIHGRAAERVPMTRGTVRGIALDDVILELRDGWTFDAGPARYPVLAELPDLSARA